MAIEIKWADVAPFFINSNIKAIAYNPESDQLEEIYLHEVNYTDGDLWQWSDSKLQGCLFELPSGALPILRALEDMTLQEKMEIFALAGPSEKPHDWEFRIKIIKEYSASELHWFISKGFDVFGLIEPGQAIRKEAEK